METHRIHPELLERQVRVLVVGCGGTGSAFVAALSERKYLLDSTRTDVIGS